MAIPPPWPSKATAALGRTRPASTSAFARRFGYVGHTSNCSRARPARPIVVAVTQGIANQAMPLFTMLVRALGIYEGGSCTP